jgi:hypothetical protein
LIVPKLSDTYFEILVGVVDDRSEDNMKKKIILIISIVCIFALGSCNSAAPAEDKPDASPPVSDASPPVSVEETASPAAADVIPASLVFGTDGEGGYYEPVLGEWEDFLAKVFISFDTGELDPGSGLIKYYGEGTDGYGYCFIVTTRNDSSGVISYNIDTAIISIEPNSGGDEVSGQDMVRWMYENFNN